MLHYESSNMYLNFFRFQILVSMVFIFRKI